MNTAANVLNGRKVLVVEDQYAVALDLCEGLDREGASVVGPASSVEDALAMLESGRPDVAVLDIQLHGGLVYPVADRLQELGVPYLFTSACEPDEIPEQYRFAPRFDKPIRLSSIIAAIRAQISAG
ncbi:MAG TPA: response regulator [Steroidobacteraceae bacterium]|jgi:CheY-like chemotaxis protein|nr:response regulator [Steroidobacteraceae bacterium]